jgi:enediyne biosynthesis protein E4
VTEPDPGSRGRRRILWLGLGATGLLSVGAMAVVAFDLFGAATPTEATAPPRFVEEARAAGIEHAYEGEWPFFLGGGVAVMDCDGDGLPDLYLAGGASQAVLYRNESTVGGELRFARVPDPVTDLGEVTGAYPLDVDGDGLVDLAVLRTGENALLRGLGDCRFERANEAWGFDGGDGWSTAFSATWENPDTLPTLAVGDFLSSTGLERTTCADNRLFRPEPGASRYAPPIALGPGWCTQSMLFSDWDRSGRADLRVSNDRQYYRDGEEQLWRIVPGEAPRLYTREEGWQRLQIWGMGIASHDLTGDGRPEVFLTSQGDNKLQTLEEGASGPSYVDIAIRRGATVHRPYAGDVDLPSTAWHAEFQDVNNDGFIDLFVAKGNVEAMPDHAARDPNNLLLGQADGTFVEAAPEAGIVTFAKARGAAVVDLNLDGMLDLVVVNRRENVELWRNVGWGDRELPAPMGGGWPSGSGRPAPTAMRSGRGSRSRSATGRSGASSPWVGATWEDSSGGCTWGSVRRVGPGSGSSGPTGSRDRG